jgi:hypothetical protein
MKVVMAETLVKSESCMITYYMWAVGERQSTVRTFGHCFSRLRSCTSLIHAHDRCREFLSNDDTFFPKGVTPSMCNIASVRADVTFESRISK